MSRARELAGFATATNPIQDLNVGVVTAISFSGDGSSLTGIDATSIKDGDGTVRAQANTSGVVVTGILTATSLEGDGSALTGLPAGLGTAVSATGDGANVYYTNQVLDVGSNLSIDVPATAVVAYTQYPEVAVSSGIDLTIADGDDFVADILGIGTTGAPQLLAGGGGRVRADNFVAKDGYNAPTFANGINVSTAVTAATFHGDGSALTGMANTSDVSTSTLNVIGIGTFGGDLIGVAASFSGNVTVGGTLTYEDVTNVDSTGIVTAKGGVRIPNDTGTITMGASDDLQLYHDASNSYIKDSGTGALRILTDLFQVRYAANNGEIIYATAAGSVQLFYNDSKKFETTNTGATITGAGICTSLSVGPGIVQEDFHSYGTALTGTYNHDVVTHGMVLDSTVAASASFVINLRGDGSTTFNSLMNVGQTTVLTVYSVSSNASYYLTDFQIDGSSITEKWNGGSAPSAGTGSGTDVYTFNIMKTASATFSVYANFSNFA